MVARRDLTAPPGRMLADIVSGLRAEQAQSKTGAAGVTDYGEAGDATWTNPDGSQKSVREVAALSDELQQTVDETKAVLGDAQAELDQAQADIDAERLARETALQEARDALAALDERLNSAPTTGDLDGIRDDLTAAREVADSAVRVAGEANTAASAASQAALEAAGIAASKGRVIVQATEPTGADRNAANIWIQPIPDDPTTGVEEKAVTYVYLEASDEWQPTTSSELAQAAQNALDAREAAQQAQQRADTAVSNAATAQAAAEAAQRTADTATTDARDAHNAAVEAAERLQAKIDAGDSLILNGSFEHGTEGYRNLSIYPRGAVIEGADAHSGTRMLHLYPDTNNAYPESIDYPTEGGRVLHARGWFKYLGGDGASSGCALLYRAISATGAILATSYFGGWGNRVPGSAMTSDTWHLISGDVTMPAGAAFFRVAAHAGGPSSDEFLADDISVIDVTEVRAAQARADAAFTEAASKASPAEVTAEITASANGKNAITVSASAPSGSGVVVGDTWWTVDGNGDIFGQWTWDGSRWAAHTVRSEVIANLDVGKLTVTGESRFTSAVVDRLYADIFTAHKITAEQIVIAALDSDGNLAPGSVGAITLQDGIVGADKLIADEVAVAVADLVKARVENLVVTDGAEINDAVILKIASEMITAGVLRTAESGQRVVIDGNGIVMYGVDPDGVEFELVRIGPNGDNLITSGDTTISPSGVQAPSGTFDELAVGGEDLSTILAPFPLGRVAQNTYNADSDYSNRAQSRISTQWTVLPGRRYRVTVTPLSLQATAATGVYFKIAYSWDYLTTTWAGASFGAGRYRLASTLEEQVCGTSGDLPTTNSAGPREMFVTFMMQSTSDAGVRVLGSGNRAFQITVDDVGPRVNDVGSHWTAGNVDEGSTAPPPPVTPTVQRYTKTYSATDFRTYDANDSRTSDADVVQGLYAGGPSRLNRRGGWLFPSMTGDLAGATVEKIEAYMYVNHTYYTAGATVNPCVWGGTMVSSLTRFTTVNGWKRNTGKWITLPSSYHAGFKSGTYAGIGVRSTNANADQYARLNASGAKIRITYTK